MKYSQILNEGQLLKRYKRFFADIEQGEGVITAHLPNTGSLKGCLRIPQKCRYTLSDNPNRKLKATLEMIKDGVTWVGVNTSIPNQLAYESWEKRLFPHWKTFDRAQREIKLSEKTRIDLVMWDTTKCAEIKKLKASDFCNMQLHFVEIKNVTMAENGRAYFPDGVTERGQKHLIELMQLIDAGHTAELLFVVQRQDCREFSPADHIDPEYGRLLREANKKGVKISPYVCQLSKTRIELTTELLPIVWDED